MTSIDFLATFVSGAVIGIVSVQHMLAWWLWRRRPRILYMLDGLITRNVQ